MQAPPCIHVIEDVLRCPIWEDASDREIAAQCGCAEKDVSQVRKLLHSRLASARMIGAAVLLREKLGLEDATLEEVVTLALWQAMEDT